MSELALDDDQRHAFAGHLDRVRVAQLVWGEAPSHSGVGSGSPQRGARGCARPVPTAGRSAHDAEQRPDGELDAQPEPQGAVAPTPTRPC